MQTTIDLGGQSAPKINYYDLGPLGAVAKFVFAEDPKAGESVPWQDIVVLDISGSMGDSVCKIVRGVLPRIYSSLGLQPNDAINLITFESSTTRSFPTIAELEHSHLRCCGGTIMAGALKHVKQILNDSPLAPFRIVVISDGQVSDKTNVLRIAESLPVEIARRTAPISVCQVQVMSSYYADPDTQATTCLGQLDTDGKIELHTISENDSIGSIAEKVVDSFKTTGRCSRLISLGSSSIVRFPGVQPVEVIRVQGNSPVLLLTKDGGALDLDSFSVDGISVPRDNITVASKATEGDLEPLLAFIESQIRQLMVLGNYGKSNTALDWVTSLETFLAPTQQCIPEGDPASLHFRRLSILAKARTTRVGIIQRIKELANMDRVSMLNSKRQAEFLQGVGNNARGRSLAKRAEGNDLGDLDQVIPNEIRAIVEYLKANPIATPKDDPRSFFSQDSLSGCLTGLLELDESDLSNFPATEIMQFVGPIGVPFKSKAGDAPDPWSGFYVESVYAGDSYLLNSADLWCAKIQGGSGKDTKLYVPGSQNEISGVLPLRSINTVAYDVFVKCAPILFKLHVSASLRGSLVPIAGDLCALLTRCALRLLNQFAEIPNESTASCIFSIIEDLRYYTQMRSHTFGMAPEVIAVMNEGDPRTVMAGDVFIPSETKPLAGILAGIITPTPRLARAVLGHMAYLSSNRSIGDPKQRITALQNLIGFTEDNVQDPGPAFTEDRVKIVYDSANLPGLKSAADMNALRTISHVFAATKVYEESAHDASQFSSKLKSVFSKECQEGTIPSFFGLEDVEDLKSVAGACLLQGILSPNLSSRIEIDAEKGTRTYKFPDLETLDDAIKFVQGETRKMYEGAYDRALKNKRQEERKLLEAELIKDLIETTDLNDFISMLSKTVPGSNQAVLRDRTDPNFPVLLAGLFEQETTGGLDKLWVLALGRDLDGNIVWLQGNPMRSGELSDIKQHFLKMGATAMWDRLHAVQQENCCWSYRASDIPNRHGHCNSFPSWWALGYSSLDLYQTREPHAASEYIKRRFGNDKN